MTLDDLSAASGVGKVTISQIENGRTPSAATKQKVSRALNLPVELVFPPPGAASPTDLLDGWVLKKRAQIEGARNRRSHTGGLDAVVDFSAIPPSPAQGRKAKR